MSNMKAILICAAVFIAIIIVDTRVFSSLSKQIRTQNSEIKKLETMTDSMTILVIQKTRERQNNQLREAFRNGWYRGGNRAIEACAYGVATGTKIKSISIKSDSLKFEQLFIDK